MVDVGVLGFREATEKGGRHRVYFPAMDEAGYCRGVPARNAYVDQI